MDHAPEARALLLLGHGAGGGPQAADLALLARRLPPYGVTVVRFEQPWRLAGRKVAVRPPALDQAWLAAAAWLTGQPWARLPLWTGGRSAGARVACRTADQLGAAGVVCLAFPLHLPGRPERSRAPELLAPSAPRLVLQGSRDAFGTAEQIREAVTAGQGTAGDTTAAGGADVGVRLVELPGADHSFRLPKAAPFTPADLRARVVAEVTLFLGVWVPDEPGAVERAPGLDGR